MISLPNECYYEIFNNFRHCSYNDQFSCALVNRRWCRIIIPILWSEQTHYHFQDLRFVRVLLLMLNAKEQALLIPFNITLPNHPKPLFEYTSYITSINKYSYYLCYGVNNWLTCKGYDVGLEIENAIKCSLVTMLIRTSKNLKHLYLNEIFCNQTIFENLYANTTVTSLDLHLTHKINDDFKFKAIDGLVKILNKSSTLTSLNLITIKLGAEGVKTLLEALYKNTVLKSLNIDVNWIGAEEGKMVAEFLCKNKTLKCLNLYSNNLGSEGGKALANALCKNVSLTVLDIGYNNLGSEAGKALADALCKNTTLKDLNLCENDLGSEVGKALAEALCKNITLTSLNLAGTNLGTKGGKALAKALCKNTTLTSLDISFNYLGLEVGKALADTLCKNTTLTSLNLDSNNLGPKGGKALANALYKNTTLTSLNLRYNNIKFKIKSNNQSIEILQ